MSDLGRRSMMTLDKKIGYELTVKYELNRIPVHVEIYMI